MYPAIGAPRRYPAPQPITRSPKLEAMIDGSIKDATVGAINEKNAPEVSGQLYNRQRIDLPADIPAKMTKMIKGASSELKGQMSNIPIPFIPMAKIRLFTGPMMSDNCPKEIRPNAEARLKPDTRPAEANDERPIDWPYIGKKKGGTRSGKVARADATQMVV